LEKFVTDSPASAPTPSDYKGTPPNAGGLKPKEYFAKKNQAQNNYHSGGDDDQPQY